jgi:hypothetical protein
VSVDLSVQLEHLAYQVLHNRGDLQFPPGEVI